VTCAGYEFKDALNKNVDGVKTTFITDACFEGGFIELIHDKVVLFTHLNCMNCQPEQWRILNFF